LLISGIHMFISLVLLPAPFGVFDASIAIRAELSNMESAYSTADSANGQFTSSEVVAGTSQISSLLKTTMPTNSTLSTTPYYSPAARSAQNTINIEKITFSHVVALKTGLSGIYVPTLETAYTPTVVQSGTTKFDIYLKIVATDPTSTANSPGVVYSNVISDTSLFASPKAYSFDPTSTATFTGSTAAIWKTAAQQNTKVVTSTLLRQELFAGFYFLQSIFSVAYFCYILTCYTSSNPPKHGYVPIGLGFLMMFIAYSAGYTPYGAISLANNLLDPLLQSNIGDFLAAPKIAILLLFYPLMAVYNTYALKINN
jgi:hypothetical protein